MEYDNYLMHYGRKNQKWGIRNFQNYDGTWTELGKARRRAMSGAGEAARQVKKALKKTGKVTAATIRRTRKAIRDASERSREKRAIKDAKRKVALQKRIEKAMRNNDVAAILKYAPNITNEQLTSAKTRAELISALSKAAPEKKKSFAQKVATDIGKYAVDKGVGLASKAVNKAANKAKSTGSSAVKNLVKSVLDESSTGKPNKPNKPNKSNTSSSGHSTWDAQTERPDNYQTNDYWKKYRQKKSTKDYNSRYDDFVNNFNRDAVTEYAKSHHGSFDTVHYTTDNKKRKDRGGTYIWDPKKGWVRA
jgi:hypothetical protein